nr:hypothetical protein [Tanacetum cinerariifolium]
MDVMRRAKTMFKDEFNGRSFTRELSWEILRKFPKWDMPTPVSTFRVEGGNAELFGEDTRRRPPRALVQGRGGPEATIRPLTPPGPVTGTWGGNWRCWSSDSTCEKKKEVPPPHATIKG